VEINATVYSPTTNNSEEREIESPNAQLNIADILVDSNTELTRDLEGIDGTTGSSNNSEEREIESPNEQPNIADILRQQSQSVQLQGDLHKVQMFLTNAYWYIQVIGDIPRCTGYLSNGFYLQNPQYFDRLSGNK
jgi:hypothetical protein